MPWMCAPGLLEEPHCPGVGEEYGTIQPQEDCFRRGRGHQEELDFLFDGLRPEVDGAERHLVASLSRGR